MNVMSQSGMTSGPTYKLPVILLLPRFVNQCDIFILELRSIECTEGFRQACHLGRRPKRIRQPTSKLASITW